MFADLTSLTTNFTTVFGLIATLAAIVFGLLSAKNKITITSLEESSAALGTLNTTQKLQIKSLTTENDALAIKAKVLEDQVTQAPDINKLILQLGKQHKEMMLAMGSMTQELGNVAKAVSKDS